MGNDTPIAAIATASGPAGVCVVRVSGEGAFEIADRLAPSGSPGTASPHLFRQRPGGTFVHTDFFHPVTREKIDDGLVLVFHAPRSFTGEDVVEFHGHGGAVPSRRLLDAALAAGARMAEAGEFSKRAFLNGRMDLTQAEAACDFIQAKTERIAHVARSQLDGALGSRINALYGAMTAHCADIEHQLDFDEGELPDTFVSDTSAAIQGTQAQIRRMIESWDTSGHLLRDGALVVISGKPNAGKSSLLNALLGRNRAIVHDAPGTTRDAIEESCALEGVPLRLVDTAGLRDTPDAVEQEGIARAERLMREADVNLFLVDSGQWTAGSLLPPQLDPARTIIVFTKKDLRGEAAAPPAPRPAPLLPSQQGTPPLLQEGNSEKNPLLEEGVAAAIAADGVVVRQATVHCSAKTGEGLDALGKLILAKLGVEREQDSGAIVNARHAAELRTAHGAASLALDALAAMPRDLVIAANHLREAAEALGRTVGRCYADDLLDAVFSRFCVGK